MFLNFFHKKSSQPKSMIDGSQAVIITIPLDAAVEFGTKDQQDQVHKLEGDIEKMLPNNAELDGDEFGDGECIIYIYGSSADEIFAIIENILKASEFQRMEIILQYGRPEDPATEEKKFSL